MCRWGSALVLSAALFVVSAAHSVHAQAVEQKPSEVSEARALFMAGRAAFDEGRYENALTYFEQSYQQSQRPLLLYNIAQCYDRMRREDEAIAAFERYIAVETDPEMRDQVEARVRALKAANASRVAAPPSVASAPTSPVVQPTAVAQQSVERERKRWWLTAPAITIASGAAVAITGGVLMAVGAAHGSDVENAHVGSHYKQLQSQLDSANHQWIAGQVLLGVGAAAAAGGVVWLLLDRREHPDRVRVSLGPTSLRLDGRF